MRHSKKMQIAESDGLEKHQHTPSKKSQNSRKINGSSGKQLQQLSDLFQDAMDLYSQSSLSETIKDMLRTKNRPRITRIVSLGLGSFLDAKDQQRRIKQLVMLMAIASHLTLPKSSLQIYAQDPTFTAVDETFLTSLGIVVLKTPSIAQLGEAGQMMDDETLVYSPFLTLETYKLLLSSSQTSHVQVNVPMLISDDFNALRLKWDKRTSERKDVEGLIQGTRAGNYRRRAVTGEGFWTDLDRPFPLALYLRQSTPAQNTIRKTSAFSQFSQSSIPIYA